MIQDREQAKDSNRKNRCEANIQCGGSFRCYPNRNLFLSSNCDQCPQCQNQCDSLVATKPPSSLLVAFSRLDPDTLSSSPDRYTIASPKPVIPKEHNTHARTRKRTRDRAEKYTQIVPMREC